MPMPGALGDRFVPLQVSDRRGACQAAALLFSLYSLLEPQLREGKKETAPTSTVTELLNSKKGFPKH